MTYKDLMTMLQDVASVAKEDDAVSIRVNGVAAELYAVSRSADGEIIFSDFKSRQEEKCGYKGMIKIEFDGVEYNGRMVRDKYGECQMIADTSLLDALQPGGFGDENDGFISDEAVALYEDVFYFCNKDEIGLPLPELVEVLSESNPDFFDGHGI